MGWENIGSMGFMKKIYVLNGFDKWDNEIVLGTFSSTENIQEAILNTVAKNDDSVDKESLLISYLNSELVRITTNKISMADKFLSIDVVVKGLGCVVGTFEVTKFELDVLGDLFTDREHS